MPPNNLYITDDEYYTRTLQAERSAHSPQIQSEGAASLGPSLGPSAAHSASTSAQGILSPMRLAASLRKLSGEHRTSASPSFSVTQVYSTSPPPAANPQHSGPSSDEEFARFLQAEEDAVFRTSARYPVSPVAGPIPPQPEISPPSGFGIKGKSPAISNHSEIPPANDTVTSSHPSGITPFMHLPTVRCYDAPLILG
jgi:hypothetical protein